MEGPADEAGITQSKGAVAVVIVALTFAYVLIIALLSYQRLRKVPGPWLYALSGLPLGVDAWKGRSVHKIDKLHKRYGPAVRVGSNQVSFNSLSALRTIYGAGNQFERTDFYRMFDVYGTATMFTFASGYHHRERKKLMSHVYANQTILGPYISQMISSKVASFIQMLKTEPIMSSEIFSSLHYFSLDSVADFVYGPQHGGTQALKGVATDREMISDILNPSRRRLAWLTVHFPTWSKWITSRTGLTEQVVNALGLVPMKKPYTYSGIRKHALDSFYSFKAADADTQMKLSETTLIGRLFRVRNSSGLSDMDIASECADVLLAGIDTTSDSLMFLIWALSLPQNRQYQQKLREELSHISVNAEGVPEPKALSHLPYLNAVLKESIRLYSPLPAFEPRTCPVDTVIDGYDIPAGTVVGCSPYCLHREEAVFADSLVFRPNRWLTPEGSLLPESDIKNKYFWAFGSGPRMCTGIHLANAEMLTLTAAVYRKYETHARNPECSPAIISRYELFSDETMQGKTHHECHIDFVNVDEK